jgi:hypothetical protein
MIYYLRKIFQKYKKCKGESLIKSIKNEISISQFNFFVSNAIITKSPLMISRFGSEEIKWYLNYKVSRYGKMQRAWYYIINEVDVWRDVTKMRLIKNLSFVPSTEEMSKTFFEEYTTAIPKIDILGSWLYLEKSQLISLNAKTRSIYLGHLEPYYSENPWTMALEGKKVLVIHPMKKSIESQYLKRKLIFGNKQILPDFHLEVLQAPYFDDPRFGSWQAIMEFYKSEVLKYNFDVAILGCGSWGMPLAGYIKDMGKIAIHLGGATQILFGIIGERWETQWPEFRQLNLVNEHWTRPLLEETPGWAKGYDKNSYW